MLKLSTLFIFLLFSLSIHSQTLIPGDTIICPEGSMFYKKCNLKDSYESRIPPKAMLIIFSEGLCFKNSMNWGMIEVQTLDGTVGFINSKNCSSKSDYLKKVEQRSIEYQNMVKIHGKVNADRILNHEYWIGMTGDITRLSLGHPDKINKTVGSWGVHEQWIYEKRNLYLYFEDGILTSYQQY